MLWGVLALISIILGVITGFVDDKDALLFDALTWFVLAIAFNTLTLVVPGLRRSE
jgi:hypothetical protein